MEELRVLLDTTAFVDLLRRVPQARAFLIGLEHRPLASEVTRVEVLRGLRTDERAPAEVLFSNTEWLAVDEPTARLAGELGRQYGRSHRGMGAMDLIVAATAQQMGASLATSNVKHFPMFPGLTSPY